MSNWLIPLGALLLLGGFLLWLYRHNGEGALVLEPVLQKWDRFRDWWENRGSDSDTPASAAVPEPGPVPAAPARVLPPPPPPSLNGGAPAAEPGMGFGPAQSDLLHAIGSLVARASGGDIRDVRRTIKTLATAADALGDGVSHLGTRLAEPDKLYGGEIWEPLAQAGAQLRSGALHMNQSDAMVTSLLNTSVGELAETPRQAPHHSQLNGPV